MSPKSTGSTGELQVLADAEAAEVYRLTLYVAGSSARSIRAIRNAREICTEYLAGRHELLVVDLFKDPARARCDQILALPTLVKHHPAPMYRIVGDLSDRASVLTGLGLTSK